MIGMGGRQITNLSQIQNSLNFSRGGVVEKIMEFFQNLAHFLFEMVNGIASHNILDFNEVQKSCFH